jgi:Lrp/AsnC family leucine-responsive transcriptional regulator
MAFATIATSQIQSNLRFRLYFPNRFSEITSMFELDAHDQKILALLQENARLSFTEIGRRVHLTAPAVTERVKRLEEAGIVTGYGARINLRKLGYSFEAFVQVTVESHAALDAWAESHAELLSLHATTGSHCAIMRLGLTSPEHLQALLESLGEIGRTTTSMVLSSTFEDRKRIPGANLKTAK